MAQFALDLNVGALLQLAGKLGEFAPGVAAVPFGARVVLALAVLPGRLGRDREHGDWSAILGGFQLNGVADEADQGNAVLIHNLNLFFPPCSLAGHQRQMARAPQCQVLHFMEEPEKNVTWHSCSRG